MNSFSSDVITNDSTVKRFHPTPDHKPEGTADTGRNPNADILKGIAILGVVFVHAGGLKGDLGVAGEILLAFSRMAVPVFVVLFAYFLEKSLQKRPAPLRFLASRFAALLVPFLIWSTLYFFWLADLDSLTFVKAITKHWSGYGWSGQYFFIILFQLLLIFPILRMIAMSESCFWLVFLASIALLALWPTFVENYLPAGVGKLGYRPVFFWIVYALAGIRMAKGIQPLIRSAWVGLSILLIPLEMMVIRNGPAMGWEYLSPSLLIATLLCVPYLLSTCPPFRPLILWRPLEFFGRNTMIVFVSNSAMVLLLRSVFPIQLEPLWLRLGFALLIILGIAATGTLIGRLLKICHLGRFAQ